MKPSKKKPFIRWIAASLLIVVGILYQLADRYLIEHVEIANVNAAAITATYIPQTAVSAGATATPSAQSSTDITYTQEESASSGSVTSDDWNYHSDTVSIAIQKVTSGSGKNTLTYFVADIVLDEAAQLQSAFADNSFGRNIIANTSEIAAENKAIFAINGDYYGFRSDGIVIRNGVVYRDEPARIGLAFSQDGSMKIYAETETSAQELLDAGVWNTLSFGPALIENGLIPSNLADINNVDTNLGNHSIQGNNPRTGVGIISENHYVFIVVDGRSSGYSRGASFSEFAQIFSDLGCTDAYNIDGGGSSTMYFMGRVVNNRLGQNRERGTSDILFIG